MKLLINSIVLTTLLFLFSISSTKAQCKWFNNKFCLPSLGDYVPNGQLLTAIFSIGESAEINSVFFKNKKYRVIICHQDVIGNVHFKLKTKKNKVLYDSNSETTKGIKNIPFPFLDISLESTKKLIIEVSVDENSELSESDVKPKGCVTIAIGYKP